MAPSTQQISAKKSCKRAREASEDGWQDGEMSSIVGETERAWKQACYGIRGEVGAGLEVEDSAWNEGDEVSSDPFDTVGRDILQFHIMNLLDSRSLARSSAVCARWRALAKSDDLWQPFVVDFLAKRALLPLCIMQRDASSISPYIVYAVAVTDSQQQELSRAEMCGRTWELRLKPPCGPYWLSLDPSQLGNPGLRRYFHCDGSISAAPNDPIWGGQESVWKHKYVKARDGSVGQHVQINKWPLLRVQRLHDGCWSLENMYATYITRPDNPTYPLCVSSSEMKASCSSCTPPTYGLM